MRKTIANNLQECFDLFNTYGKDENAFQNILFSFDRVFQDTPHDQADIQRAFTVWMKRSTAMPTPKDILDIIEVEIMPHKRKSASPSVFRSFKPHELQDWQRKLVEALGEAVFCAWLKDAEYDGQAIKARNQFTADFLIAQHLPEIRECLGSNLRIVAK